MRLGGLASYEDPLENLDAALVAFRAAGEVTTLERGVAKWQGLQTAMGTTLMMRGIKAMDKASVLEAQKIMINARDTLREVGQPDEAFYDQFLPMVDSLLAMFPN